MELKRPIVIILLITLITTASLYVFSADKLPVKESPALPCCLKTTTVSNMELSDSPPKGCVFKTVFEGQYNDTDFICKTPESVAASIKKALEWMAKEQLQDGGWSGGFHVSQQVLKDPNAKSDPATTAMVSMAFLRCGTDPLQGPYVSELNRATEFLLSAVEGSTDKDVNITKITGSQPQVKLGGNIDVMLTSQYLTNIMTYYQEGSDKHTRVKKCIEKCVGKIQKGQNANGSFVGAGWAGVLQSSIANNALETAAASGIKVDTTVLEKSRDYQKGNFNAANGSVTATDGAGVVLYSLSSTGRASANEAVKAKKAINKAKKEGKIKQTEDVSKDNLMKAGMSESEAMKYDAAYQINASSSKMAQTDNVMAGFGNNGGEEFFSFLQTGEGLIISRDKTWKQWYGNVSGKLLKIQEKDGNWQGHHCITSPVFCTATCLLILSVNNDIDRLLAMGN